MPVQCSRILSILGLLFLTASADATFCVPPSKPAQPKPPTPPPPVCEPKKCDKCSKSPCYLATGAYIADFVDLEMPTAGSFGLTLSRRYDSTGPSDGPLGVGWSSSLTPRLYYSAYLLAAPSTYSYEADVMLPDGVVYTFSQAASGAFTPPFGRRDVLVRNADGTYAFTIQRSRSVYRFNADGSLASLTDDYGNVITYTYSGGRVQRIADAAGSGRYLDVTWGADGHIASVQDNGGRIVKYFYEGTGSVLTSYSDAVASTNSGSRTAYYTYVGGRFEQVLSRVEDRWHRVVTALDWYPDGRLQSYTEGSFDPANPTGSPGERYTYTYSGTSVTKSNTLGTTTYAVAPNGLVNDQVTFNAAGQIGSATNPDGTNFRQYTYDTVGRVATRTDAAATWYYSYDANFPDKATAIIPKDNWGNLKTDWPGRTYEYSPPGAPAPGALIAEYRVRSDLSTKDKVLGYTYDVHGHVTSVTNDAGEVAATYVYTAGGQIASETRGGISTTSFGYDSMGRRTSITTADGQVTSFTYDQLDRVTSITLPKPTATSNLNFVRTFAYDQFDSLSGLVFTTVTDANGRTTRTGSNAAGLVEQVINEVGGVTQKVYRNGLLSKVIDPNGNATMYGYGSSRELASVTSPNGGVEAYTVNNGRVGSHTDRSGQQVTFAHDSFGRLSQVTYGGLHDPYGSFVGYSFTYQGENLVEVSDQQPTSRTVYQYAYDSSWRPVTQNIVGGEKTTWTYFTGPATTATWASNRLQTYTIEPSAGASGTTQTVAYGYDSLGRVQGVTWSWVPGIFTFEYNPTGQLSRLTFPNGQSRSYSYDGQQRLTNVTNKDVNGAALAAYDYGYDYDFASGTYSLLGRRTSLTVSAVPAANFETGVTRYQYDGHYWVTRVDRPASGYDTWSYDPIGNIVNSRTATYTYYTNGQNTANGLRLRSYSGFTDLMYDANGNMLGKASTPVSYAFDYAGRLTSAEGYTYSYDYFGSRRTATSNTTTRYISHGGHTVGERNATLGVSTDYLFGPGLDMPLAKHTASGAVQYFGADGLGSITLVTDTNGSIVNSASYDAWGARAGGSMELFGFAGREASGTLWFNRARYYSPMLGRFLSEDPLLRAETGSRVVGASFHFDGHAYSYARNDPISLRDPLGWDAGGANQGPTKCVSEVAGGYLDDTAACYREFITSPGQFEAEVAVCMTLEWPWKRVECLSEAANRLRNAKKTYEECKYNSLLFYKENLLLCCSTENPDPDGFDYQRNHMN